MPRTNAASSATKEADDPRLVERVREALAGIPKVTERRMFGGTGFMIRGHLCLSARPARIMCRIDPATHDEAIEREGCSTMTMKGREYRGYVRVDASAVRTKRELKYWVDRALKFSRTLPAKK